MGQRTADMSHQSWTEDGRHLTGRNS